MAYFLTGLNVNSNLLRLIRDGGNWGGGDGYLCPTTYSPPELLCIKAGSSVRHFNVLLIVWAKSQDSVHKSQFLKRKENRSGSNRGPSAYKQNRLTARTHQLTSMALGEATTYRAWTLALTLAGHEALYLSLLSRSVRVQFSAYLVDNKSTCQC